MAERHAHEHIHPNSTAVKRRGLLAGAAALVAGIAAKQTAQPVAAANLVLETTNTVSTAGTVLTWTGTPFTFGSVLGVGDTGGPAPQPIGAMVSGTSTNAKAATGVFGQAASNGVVGFSDGGNGVNGFSTSGVGVRGFIDVTNAASAVAVKGINQSTGTNGLGVFGQCDVSSGIGVQGQSTGGIGVFGVSNGNAGVLGITTAPGNAGLGGIANVSGTAAFAGTSTNPNAFAGFFTGDVFVNGNFTVNDPTRKHGAIQHPDGSHRILYSMESPESWIEDFGMGQIAQGKAAVQLDADFAAVVQTDEYYVFLTDRGVRDRLTVTAQEATGFTVEAGTAGASGGFYWRVVAKPKTTNKAERMAKFTIPEIKVPDVAALAQTPPSKPWTVPTEPKPTVLPSPQPPSRPSPPATPPQGSGTTQGGATSPVQPAPSPRSG